MATNHLRLFSSKWSVTVLRPFWWCVTISHRKPTFQRAWNSQIPQPLSQQTPCFALLLVSPSCFWSPTHFCTIILGQSSYSATIQTIWPTHLELQNYTPHIAYIMELCTSCSSTQMFHPIATIQTTQPTTLGTSKLDNTYILYHQTLYIMLKCTTSPLNHKPQRF